MKIKFKLDNITKGAVRYQEINEQGQPLEGDEGHICTMYFRKAKLGNISPTWASTGEPSKFLTVTVDDPT